VLRQLVAPTVNRDREPIDVINHRNIHDWRGAIAPQSFARVCSALEMWGWLKGLYGRGGCGQAPQTQTPLAPQRSGSVGKAKRAQQQAAARDADAAVHRDQELQGPPARHGEGGPSGAAAPLAQPLAAAPCTPVRAAAPATEPAAEGDATPLATAAAGPAAFSDTPLASGAEATPCAGRSTLGQREGSAPPRTGASGASGVSTGRFLMEGGKVRRSGVAGVVWRLENIEGAEFRQSACEPGGPPPPRRMQHACRAAQAT
jgi:hypothetical protein